MASRSSTQRLAPALAAVLAAAAGCAAPSPTAPIETPGALAPARVPTPLERLAVEQRRTPRPADRHAILARLGEEAAWLRDRPAPADAAPEPLDAAVARLAARPVDFAGPAPHAAPPDAGNAETAARLYASGRLQRLAGESLAAAGVLERAARLDPASPRLLEELAEAQTAAGLEALARTSFRRAVAAGSDGPRALLAVARDERDAARDANAAIVAARALRSERLTPETRPLALAILSDALAAGDQEAAAAEAARRAVKAVLDLGERSVVVDPRYTADLQALFRRIADLGLRAGDDALRRGDLEQALADYRIAAEAGGLRRGEIESRRLLTLTLAGRPAEAAAALIAAVREEPAPITPRRVAWLRTLAETDERTRREIAAELERLGAERADAPRSVRESLLLARTAVAAAPDPLGAILPWVRSHGLSARVLDAALAGADEAELVRRGVALVAADPAAASPVADAVLWRTADPAALRAALADAQSPAGRLLHAATVLEMGYPELVPPGLPADADADAEIRTGFDALLAEAAAQRGDWAAYNAALDRLRQTAEPEGLPLLRALVAGQRLAEAFPLARRIAEREPTPDAFIRVAALAGLAGSPEEQEQALRRAAELDPYAPEPLAGLIAMHSPGGALPDRERARTVARTLGERLPGSIQIAILAAREQIGRGLLADAERTLLAAEGVRRDPEALAMLAGVWAAAQARGDADAAVRGRDFLARLAGERPLRPEPALRLGELLLAGGDHDAAAEAVDDAVKRLGHHEIGRLRERIAREAGDAEGAARLARERLTTRGRGIHLCLELATLADALGEPALAARAVSEIPPEAELSAGQRETLAHAAASLAASALRAGPQKEGARAADASLALFDALDARDISLARDRRETLVRLRALAAPPDLDRLRHDIESGIAEGIEAEDLYALAAGFLAAAERDEAAYGLLRRAVTGAPEGPPRPELVRLWLELIGSRGDADDARAAVEAVEAAGLLQQAAEVVRLRESDRTDTPARARAGIHYMAATFAAYFDRPEADGLYRAALAEDPDHPWAANDLGYLLAEQNRDLAEAERLLERALGILPDEPSIIDSLGWVRYRLGVLEDRPPREGAITLLRRATQMDRDPSSDMFRQLGDALYRSGDRGGALAAWTRAFELANEQIRAASERAPGARPSPAMQRALEASDAVAERLSAVRRGAEPELPEISSQSEDPERSDARAPEPGREPQPDPQPQRKARRRADTAAE